ncbi:hypothetical protein [Rhodovibrio sodomensis]|nr:hypothetical protein [Rhodovibrio sodomensis]
MMNNDLPTESDPDWYQHGVGLVQAAVEGMVHSDIPLTDTSLSDAIRWGGEMVGFGPDAQDMAFNGPENIALMGASVMMALVSYHRDEINDATKSLQERLGSVGDCAKKALGRFARSFGQGFGQLGERIAWEYGDGKRRRAGMKEVGEYHREQAKVQLLTAAMRANRDNQEAGTGHKMSVRPELGVAMIHDGEGHLDNPNGPAFFKIAPDNSIEERHFRKGVALSEPGDTSDFSSQPAAEMPPAAMLRGR